MGQRIIKFKAKRLGDGKWVEGYYVKKVAHNVVSKYDVVEDGEEHFIFGMAKDDVQPYWYEVDPTTVCQSTGLEDMKGWEIWEHDYIIDFPRCGEVIFVDGVFAMHSDVGDLPLETFVDRVKDNPLKTYGNCLVTSQGSRFDKKGGE